MLLLRPLLAPLLLTTSLLLLTLHTVHTLLTSTPRPLLPFLLAAPLAWATHRAATRLLFALRAQQQGCQPGHTLPGWDHVLGLDTFAATVRALRSHGFHRLFQARFGAAGATTYWTNNLGSWALMTCEPANVRAILSGSFEGFAIAGPRLHAVLPALGPKSIFSSNGKAWQESRAMIRPSFVRNQVADLACFDRHIADLLARLPRDGSTFDIQELIMGMTMDSSTDFMLGYSTNMLKSPQPEAQRFVRAFETAAQMGSQRAMLGNLARWVPSRQLDEAVQTIREFISLYMEQAAAAAAKADGRERSYVFFDELVKSGAPADYVRDQILSIIIAGRDTTAHAISSCCYYLARDPEVQRRCHEEIAAVGAEDPTWEQLKNMKYLNNVVKEALRLLPPVASNSRSTTKELVLPKGGGPDGQSPLLVPKGTSCRFSTYSMHRREDIFGPDAAEFRPDRWNELRPSWEYLPFSGGPRICIGQQFALTQILLTLFRVLQQFKAIEARDPPGPPLLRASTTISFANGVLVSMTPA